jgi:hypothetical protein
VPEELNLGPALSRRVHLHVDQLDENAQTVEVNRVVVHMSACGKLADPSR